MSSHDVVEIIVTLIELYVALGVMAIGFGYMMLGRSGGGRAAEFYFARSLRWLLARLHALLVRLVNALRTVLFVWILRPLAWRLRHALRSMFADRKRALITLTVLALCVLVLAAVVSASPARAQTLTLQSPGHNMFRTSVRLNDTLDIVALVDTGASSLSLCSTTAQSLALELGATVRVSTANGITTARRTTVRSVRIGPFELRDVVAVVRNSDVPCEEALIGMSVLRQLHITIDGETMILAARQSVHDSAHVGEFSLLTTIGVMLLGSLIGMPKSRTRLFLRSRRATAFGHAATIFHR